MSVYFNIYYRNTPCKVNSLDNVSQVAAGSSHTLVLSKDGSAVWSFGDGSHGMSTLLYRLSYDEFGKCFIDT